MRKIDKSLELATEYKIWLETLQKDGHPSYTSSLHQHYYSIVANLLHVQKGLCAYTEMALCSPEDVAEKKWENGTFKKFDFMGQLDHYNPTLKKKNGWLWENFFMIHTDINIKKKRSNVAQILKPDRVDFNVKNYLSYNEKQDYFFPKSDLPNNEQQTLLNDIDYLGLNHNSIVYHRKMTLKPIIEKIKYGALTPAEAEKELFQFFTAYEMALAKILEVE